MLLFHSKKSNQNSCQNKLTPVKQYFDGLPPQNLEKLEFYNQLTHDPKVAELL